MTATTAPANTTATTDETPVVDVDVVSSENTTEEPATGESTAAAADSSPAVSKEQQTLLDDAKRVEERNSKGREYSRALEFTGHYQDLGCFYAASTPVPASFGAEIGVVTKDEKTGAVQRTGIGFYIRSDHMADVKYDCSDF